jgi:transcription termination factor Rho
MTKDKDPEYNSFLKQSIDLKNIRDQRKKEVSKDILFKSCKKKIQTTMIGALDVVEKRFGFLWSFEGSDELSEEQKQLKDIYDEARADILDKGNNQIRNLESEFSNYEVTKKRFQINLPVSEKNQENKNGK